MNRREQILLIAAVILVTFAGYYFLALQPQWAANEQLSQDLDTAKKELERLQGIAAQREPLEKEFTQLQGFILSVEGKLPTMKDIPTLLVQLERLTKNLRISLQTFRPAALEAVGASAPAPAAGGGTAQAPAPTGGAAQAPKPAPQYFRLPIRMSINASYSQTLQLMSQLRDFPRLIRVKKIGVNPRSLPELNLDLDVDTYVIPKEGG